MSYAYLQGQHEYTTLPLFPIEMEETIHEKPNRKKTWGKQTVKGTVLGNSTEHYRY